MYAGPVSNHPMNALFFAIVAFAAIGLFAAMIFGVARWQQTKGKVIAIAAGLLLLSLIAFVAVVLLIANGARDGAPM